MCYWIISTYKWRKIWHNGSLSVFSHNTSLPIPYVGFAEIKKYPFIQKYRSFIHEVSYSATSMSILLSLTSPNENEKVYHSIFNSCSGFNIGCISRE